MFYGIGFDDQVRKLPSLVISGSGPDPIVLFSPGNLTQLTSIQNMKSSALGEVWRFSFTNLTANASIQFLLPTFSAEKSRFRALLGVRQISGSTPWVVTAGFSTPTQIEIGSKPKNIGLSTGLLLIRPKVSGVLQPATFEIGRYFVGDLCKLESGPWDGWEDGGEDSGSVISTRGFNSYTARGASRRILTIPVSVITEKEAYEGSPVIGTGQDQGFSSLDECRLFAGVSDQVIAGRFDEIAMGVFSGDSNKVGAQRLVYGTLAEMPSINRASGPYYNSSIKLLECK